LPTLTLPAALAAGETRPQYILTAACIGYRPRAWDWYVRFWHIAASILALPCLL